MEEDASVKEGRSIYMEALKRGTKRLAYRTLEAKDLEEVQPRVKRMREEGQYGDGWEQMTPERSPDPGDNKDPKSCRVVESRPRTFTEVLRRRQQDIRTLFGKTTEQQHEDTNTQPENDVRRYGRSTPVRTKVQRYENLVRDSEVGKSLRKVRKMKDKPGEGIQSSIKKGTRTNGP